MLGRHLGKRAKQGIGREGPDHRLSVGNCREVPHTVCQNLRNAEQVIDPELPSDGMSCLVENKNGTLLHKIEMRCRLPGAKERLTMKQRDV